jgi:hypothetical protein
MRRLFFLALLVLSCAHAGAVAEKHGGIVPAKGWTVEVLGDDVWASHADLKNLRVALQKNGGGTPRVLSWQESSVARGVYLLKYAAGEMGTSEPVLEVRVAAVRLKDNKVLVDEVYAYKNAERPEEDSGPQPSWTWTTKTLLIQRPDSEKPLKIAL